MSLQSHFVTGPSGPIFWLVLFALWRVDRPFIDALAFALHCFG